MKSPESSFQATQPLDIVEEQEIEQAISPEKQNNVKRGPGIGSRLIGGIWGGIQATGRAIKKYRDFTEEEHRQTMQRMYGHTSQAQSEQGIQVQQEESEQEINNTASVVNQGTTVEAQLTEDAIDQEITQKIQALRDEAARRKLERQQNTTSSTPLSVSQELSATPEVIEKVRAGLQQVGKTTQEKEERILKESTPTKANLIKVYLQKITEKIVNNPKKAILAGLVSLAAIFSVSVDEKLPDTQTSATSTSSEEAQAQKVYTVVASTPQEEAQAVHPTLKAPEILPSNIYTFGTGDSLWKVIRNHLITSGKFSGDSQALSREIARHIAYIDQKGLLIRKQKSVHNDLDHVNVGDTIDFSKIKMEDIPKNILKHHTTR